MFFHIQQLNLFEVVLKLLHALWVVVSQVTIQGAAVILCNSLKVVVFMCSVSGKQLLLDFAVTHLFLLRAVPLQVHEFCFSLSSVLGSLFGFSCSAQNAVQLYCGVTWNRRVARKVMVMAAATRHLPGT